MSASFREPGTEGIEEELLDMPRNAVSLPPTDARNLFRLGIYHGSTAGFCRGRLQAGLAVLPVAMAGDFAEFCRRNHAVFPLLYRSRPGELGMPLSAIRADYRSDIPRYYIYSKGCLVEDTDDLLGFDLEHFVTFYTGCSFSWEPAIAQAGLELRNVTDDKLVPIYQTDISLHKVGAFSGQMWVTMRPFLEKDLEKVVEITAQYPDAHGAPVHIGDPARIGVDLGKVVKGEVVEVKNGEVPVFWGCGGTSGLVLANAKPELAATNYPGSMYITDKPIVSKPLQSPPKLIKLSREGSPFFTSVISEEVWSMFSRLEEALLDSSSNSPARPLFQESDLLRATLALSHSRNVAITTGHPAHTQDEVKEGTDGLPGVLAVAQALINLGTSVTLIADSSNATLFNLVTEYAASTASHQAKIEVLLLDNVRERERDGSPKFDCLLAVGRIGRNKSGAYLSRDGKDLSKYLDPIDSLFKEALSDSRVSTIAVVCSGNEIGAGKAVKSSESEQATGDEEKEGPKSGCVVATDWLVTADVVNWGGQALAGGLYAVSQCPLHWRYRNHGVDAETPPTVDINDFVNSERFISTLQYMNSLGVRDGVTGSLEQSVGGVALPDHLRKIMEISDISEL